MPNIKINIPKDKVYKLPEKVVIIKHQDKHIVISPNTANWLVLDNEMQLDFYFLLTKNPLDLAINKFTGNSVDYQNVVIQIEAKSFENTKVFRKSLHGKSHVYLTNGCNLRCPHCYMTAGKRMESELTTNEIMAFLKSYADNGGINVTLSGGEITTRKDLVDIVRFGKKVGLKLKLLTNGTLWTEELIDNIAPNITCIQISIDGCNEEENAKIRGRGNFQRSLNTIDEFVKRNVPIQVAITPIYTEHLETLIDDYCLFIQNMGKRYGNKIRIILADELLDGRTVKLTPSQQKSYKEIMSQICDNCSVIDKDMDFVLTRRNKFITDNCSYGDITLFANGDVYVCNMTPQLSPVANIKTSNISDVFEICEKMKQESNVEQLAPCNSCELKYICGGECRIKYFDYFKGKNDTKIRSCNKRTKEKYYELMIRTNIRIFQ